MAASWRGSTTSAGIARFSAARPRRGVRWLRRACRPGRALVGALLLTLLTGAACACLAGCGAGHPAAASPAYEVQSGFVRGLGQIVTDGRGFTLYIYVPDRQGRSVCTGVCASQWPPLVLPRGVRRPLAGPGVSRALLGTTRRADGSLQVTYNRWPLYLWQGDVAPGQATGQAEGMGLWYTLTVGGSVDRLPLP
jgi:predicted lipoprotein with Yx(FWY)xxD motif